MKRTLKTYFTTWWIPLGMNLIHLGVFAIGILLKRDWIIDTALIIFFINIIGTIISSIVQVLIKKWYFIFLQLGLTGILFIWISMILTFDPPDYYGAHKEIPKGIDIYEPLENKPTESDFDNFDLILTGWGGTYTYHTDYQPTEKGDFFIKAFEINSHDRLSVDRIKERSKIHVDDLEQHRYEGGFTIYEGSWGDKYGSKIELWFQPANGRNEYKITERNFIVEGWMR